LCNAGVRPALPALILEAVFLDELLEPHEMEIVLGVSLA
jgi:hypothetical protein